MIPVRREQSPRPPTSPRLPARGVVKLTRPETITGDRGRRATPRSFLMRPWSCLSSLASSGIVASSSGGTQGQRRGDAEVGSAM